MGQLLVFMDKKVQPKGLKPNTAPNIDKLDSFLFDDEIDNLSYLHSLSSLPLSSPAPTLFYPGCGADIIYPLLYCDVLFPSLSQLHLLFLDVEPSYGMIRTILDELEISFAEKHTHQLQFYWHKKLVTLEMKKGNAFQMIKELHSFDIYFERAFRIMKDADPEYEQNVFSKLKLGGILISDSGYGQFPLQKVSVAPELSAYKEMIIGIKKDL